MDDLYTKLGGKIKDLRKKLNYTQSHLAVLVGVDPKYISRLETGTSSPSLNVISKLSEALNADISELFTFEKETDKIKLINVINTNLQKANTKKLNAILEVVKVMLD